MRFSSDDYFAIDGPFRTSHILPSGSLCFRHVDDKVVKCVGNRSPFACQPIEKLADYLCPLRAGLLDTSFIFTHVARRTALHLTGWTIISCFLYEIKSSLHIPDRSFYQIVGTRYDVKAANRYILPIPKNSSPKIDRTASPAHIGKLKNAIDFIVDAGMSVLAAADGVVTCVRDDSYTGGPSFEYWQDSNFIVRTYAVR